MSDGRPLMVVVDIYIDGLQYRYRYLAPVPGLPLTREILQRVGYRMYRSFQRTMAHAYRRRVQYNISLPTGSMAVGTARLPVRHVHADTLTAAVVRQSGAPPVPACTQSPLVAPLVAPGPPIRGEHGDGKPQPRGKNGEGQSGG